MKWRTAAEALTQSRFKDNRLVKFISEVFVELDAVTWPTKDEVISSVYIVMLTVVFFTVYMGVVDSGLTSLQSWFYDSLKPIVLGG
jgi:preprotein translocase SecE subunit